MKHKTVQINVDGEIVNVDELIAPLVKWLNSLPGVVTLFSCQGGEGSSPFPDIPYVLFFASQKAVIKILETMSRIRPYLYQHEVFDPAYPRISIGLDPSGDVRYKLCLTNRRVLKLLIRESRAELLPLKSVDYKAKGP